MSTLSKYIIIFCCTLFPLFSFAGILLDIHAVKIAKGYQAEFLFDLEEDDNFSVTYKVIEGTGNDEDLSVYLVDLNQLEEEKIMDFKQRYGAIRVPATGKYKLVFEYNGSGRFSWKNSKYLKLKLSVESLNTLPLNSGESRQILQVGNLPLDSDLSNAFKIVYSLKKGDKLYFASGDPKASFVKIYIQQLGLRKFINGLGTLTIENDGEYTFEFYLEENKEASGIYGTLQSLLTNEDLNFTDLIITREKEVKATMSYGNQSGGSMYGDNTTTDENSTEEIDPNENIRMLMEQMQNSSSNSVESQAAFMQIMQEQLKILEENSRKKEIVEVTPTPRAPISLRLSPTSNFAMNQERVLANRRCEVLNLKGGGLFNIWFYWIGVGENAEKAFNLSQSKFASYNQKNMIQEKSEYYYFSNSGEPEKAGTNPPLPKETDPAYAEYLNEDVEYAVVDYNNSLRFLQGERYTNLSLSNYKYVTADEGISFLPSSADQEYFLCVCNNNKSTPIDVFFTYFTISTTTSSY